MIINRRIFVQSAALVGAAPVLANLLLLPSGTQSREFQKTALMPAQHTRVNSDANSSLFKIDGWDRNDIGVDRSQLDSHTVIRLTQSWRTAWR
jgi:hypothetical protein